VRGSPDEIAPPREPLAENLILPQVEAATLMSGHPGE